MIKDYIYLALGNLRHRGLRSWLTIIGIFIGIVAVVSLISLGDGLKLAVNSQFGISSTQVLTVEAGGISGYGPPGTGVVNPLTKDDAEAIGKLSSVKLSISRNIRSAKFEFNKRLAIGYMVSIPTDKEKRDYGYEIMDLEPMIGKLVSDDPTKVTLGYSYSLSDKSGFNKAIRVGDTITLNGKNYEVGGIMKQKGSFIFDYVILMNEDEMRDLLDYGNVVDIIGVIAKDKDSLNKTKVDIEKLLRKRRDVKIGQEDFIVSTPDSALATVNQILMGVQIFIVMIASISIIVGAVGIANTMITSVLERRKEIGTMKAIGAKNSGIFYLFLIEAGMLGLVGGLVGVIVGSSIGYVGTIAINNFVGSTVSPNLNLPLIFFTLFGSFLIGALSGILPALKAAKLNPIAAMRS